MMTYFFSNCVFENVMLPSFLLIHDVIKIIMMTCFFINYIFENDMFLLFLRIRNNCDIMFFDNCIFKNDIFMYILLYHLYQPNN